MPGGRVLVGRRGNREVGTKRSYSVLFLCTGHSARSIFAESILNHVGEGRFRGYSAGSHPKGEVHPLALDLLKSLEMSSSGLRSKSWDEFAAHGAPGMDFVITVCDNAAGEVCPVWPGKPVTAHWGVPDPAAASGDDMARKDAFRAAFRRLESRIRLFTALPIAQLDGLSLKRKMEEIGETSI